jgi:transposase
VPPTAAFCPECGGGLTEEAVDKTERIARRVREIPRSHKILVDEMVDEKMANVEGV